MVQFTLEEKRVRFDITLDAASGAGLRISSRLLALARIVKTENAASGRKDSVIRDAETQFYAGLPGVSGLPQIIAASL
jgi:hypothetical protein